MQQAGLNSIVLYENKDVSLTYDASGNVSDISNSGAVITIENDENRPRLSQDIDSAANNDLLMNYIFDFLVFDFDQDTILSFLSTSIYGFIPVFNMNDSDVFLVNQPFFAEVGELNAQSSNSWPVSLTPRNPINNVDVKEVV